MTAKSLHGPCKVCRSHAINHNCHGRDGSDGDLCDVCYWRKRAENLPHIKAGRLTPA